MDNSTEAPYKTKKRTAVWSNITTSRNKQEGI
jgi:hypothetical protein